jgi:hypothetical protein
MKAGPVCPYSWNKPRHCQGSPAVLLLDHVAGLGQVGDDAVGAAFRDAQSGCDVAQPHPRPASGRRRG